MSIAIFDIPIPVIVDENGDKKEGYAIYVESGKTFEDDCWCVTLKEDGVVRHYLSKHIRIHYNGTFEIKKDK